MVLADTLSCAYSVAVAESTTFTEDLALLSTVDADQMTELRMIASADTIKVLNNPARDDIVR